MEDNYGTLIHQSDIKLHRKYFAEMAHLLGIKVIYRAPREDKHWTTYGEIDSNYYEPIVVDCIFDEHPNQWTMKKLGWVAELQEAPSLISVPYDTPKLQVGALFIVPGGLDGSQGRLFRVSSLLNTMIYPSAITCQLVPEYENVFSNDAYVHEHSSFNLLNREEEHL